MINRQPILLVIGILMFFISGCERSKTEEIKRGRLSYVKTLYYGAVGTHGSRGWYVGKRAFYVEGGKWSPKGVEIEDIADCEASPNETVEAFKCYSFANLKEAVYVLRVNAAGKPEWVSASDASYETGKNPGEWTGEGYWLLFKDYFFDVQTSDRKDVKGLPDYPATYFRAASPDLETIIYQETCFSKRYDLSPGESHDDEIDKQCKLYYERSEKGIVPLWLIDAKTGNVKVLEFKKEKYPWLLQGKDEIWKDWIANLREKLVWEKERDGKYQLVFPN